MTDSINTTSQSGLLWAPTPESIAQTNLTRYLKWLEIKQGLKFPDYPALWTWSTNEPGAFWSSLAEFFEVRFFQPAHCALSSTQMPGAEWFSGATVNYAEHALRTGDCDEAPAIIFEAEPGQTGSEHISRTELRRQVALVAAELRDMGIKPGDRVAGYLSNTIETIVVFLASASLGAIWSNCPVEMTSRSVLDRMEQIEPKVLFASCGYWYGGKKHDRSQIVAEIVAGLPTLNHVVLIANSNGGELFSKQSKIAFRPWEKLLVSKEIPALQFEPVSFGHPLWILYSSGTTGKPKAIVHGHGGILLEHLKALALHLDLRTGDRFFWYTTSGWMMWNFLVSGLLLPGVSIVLFDGSPKHPNFNVLWDLVARLQVNYFGASAPYFMACRKQGLTPGRTFNLDHLRGVGSTAAPLPVEGFHWIYDEVKRDIVLGSISGGTDVCSAFILSNPHQPVRAGQLQCLGLGAKIEAWNDKGQSIFGAVGELVLTTPFPSMPVCLWNDPGGARFRSSYFEKFPGVWSHGDWIEIDGIGGPCVIHGRSDATLNRGGVRMGTVEFYSIVEALPEIFEALVIDTGGLGREDKLLLFVALQPGLNLDDSLRTRIVQKLRSEVSPRHVPDAIYHVPEIPRTLSGKKLEVPIKRILAGAPVDQVVHPGAMANPASLEIFVEFSKTLFPANQVS